MCSRPANLLSKSPKNLHSNHVSSPKRYARRLPLQLLLAKTLQAQQGECLGDDGRNQILPAKIIPRPQPASFLAAETCRDETKKIRSRVKPPSALVLIFRRILEGVFASRSPVINFVSRDFIDSRSGHRVRSASLY